MASTYKWLLANFLEVMMNKHPKVVVTDADEAMKEVINEIFPNTTHKLCGWHLQKNATLNIKDLGLRKSFKKFIYAKWDVNEFEEEWSKLVEEFGGSDMSWIDKQYENKESWAREFLQDKFCAGFRTTSRCEGIKNFIKRFVHSRHNILELVENLERALRDYRNNEMVAQFKTINSDPVLTTGLPSLELCAANIYTREIFKLVRKQIEEVVSLDIIHSQPLSTTMVYKICAFQKRVKIFTVVYDRNEKKLECECCHWDHEGYPCSHMLCVLRREDIDELPESLILKRWTRDAKKYTNDQTVESSANDAEKGFLMRYSAMLVATIWMSFLAAQEVLLFGDTMNEVTRWTKDLEKRCNIKRQNGVTNVLHPAAEFIGDPCVAKTKGAPKLKKNETRKRSCSNCFVKGHTKRHCPKLVDEGDRSHDHFPSRCTDTDETIYAKIAKFSKEPLGATRSENNGRNCTAESSTKLMGSQSNLAGIGAFSGVQFYPTLSNLFPTPQGGVPGQPTTLQNIRHQWLLQAMEARNTLKQ
ncbi:protein FAR-RED ELONGATED HYPOCOTYL 3-like [Arachis ipaensis]|uniref:protein FAR-RED ELONGATED HYPOCOTYL 3-like n=1 Tax=Arachis ipaensis TaxID=130454 RepID=UPI0007AEFC15|nr:protein FAR-RED ELONGATED HYPOCOTYL 3-like [Arachis ipaensis]XP_025647952.1 protein FAR-RED ELONGATED HYPOCOTYL 3-like [Arachis hypogaea]